jgi:hypothetical protein
MAENFYTQLTDKGLTIPDTSGILDGVQTEFTGAFGYEMDVTTPETPQGRLIETISSERASVLSINAENMNQLNLDYATGVFLDAHGTFFRVERIGARSTRVLATVSGVYGTVIKARSVAKTTDDDQFYAENDISIPASGSTTAYFLSVEKGPIPCDTGTLTSIVSSTSSGWETISNTSPAIIGNDRESDTEYRARIKASRYSGTSFSESIASEVNKVDNLKSSFVYDNGTAIPFEYDESITLDAHSVVVVADGGTNLDIAEAIYRKKSGGCAYTRIGKGTIEFSGLPSDDDTVTVDGQDYTFKTTLTSPDVSYEVLIGGSASAASGNLKKAINADGAAGTDYGTGTLANPTCTATVNSATVTVSGGTYGETLVSEASDNTVATVLETPLGVTQTVDDETNGTEYQVVFNRPRSVSIIVDITVIDTGYAGSDLAQAVKDVISDWAIGEISGFTGLKIAGDGSPFQIASVVSSQLTGVFVSLCKVAVHGGTTAATTLEVLGAEIAEIVDDSDITVTVV